MKGEQICEGISQEIVDACIELGGAFPENRGHLHNAYGNTYSVTPIDPEVLKLVTQKLCVEAGVRLMLGAFIVGPVADGETIQGIRVVSKSGEQRLLAKVVIDASGDADIVAKAGGAFQVGDDAGKTMSISLLARMGNVDLTRHLQYVKERPDQFMLGEDPYIGKTRQEIASELTDWKDFPMVTGYYEAVKRSASEGRVPRQPRTGPILRHADAWSSRCQLDEYARIQSRRCAVDDTSRNRRARADLSRRKVLPKIRTWLRGLSLT